MPDRTLNVLFICTGNSARSIIAEVLMNHVGKGRFRAFSAGSHPSDRVSPFALEVLRVGRLSTDGLRSKSWDEFAAPGAPAMDFILTVCDKAAGEVCPVWPGSPITAHWGVPDPVAVEGTDDQKLAAFRSAAAILRRRIDLPACRPIDKLEDLSIQQQLRDIGKI